jgi:hypothetical protein
MTPPSCFYFGKIKTVMKLFDSHFVFMHLRPSSRGLQDAPSKEKYLFLRNKIKQLKCSHRLQYFTQRILYNFLCIEVNNILIDV